MAPAKDQDHGAKTVDYRIEAGDGRLELEGQRDREEKGRPYDGTLDNLGLNPAGAEQD